MPPTSRPTSYLCRGLRLGLAAAFAVAGSVAGVTLVAAPAAAASAACVGTLYFTDNAAGQPGNVRAFNPAGGQVGATLYDARPGTGDSQINQLGIGKGGAFAVSTVGTATPGSATLPSQIVSWDAAATGPGTTRNEAKPTPPPGTVAGAVDPDSGTHYYGGYAAVDGTVTLTLFGFDHDAPAGSRNLGQVARITLPSDALAAGINGDLAFSPDGRLYFVAATAGNAGQNNAVSSLYRLDRLLTDPVRNGVFPAEDVTQITRTTDLPSASNGIAFASDGRLYLGRGTEFTRVNPITGLAEGAAIPFNGSATTVASTDLGSCAGPNTVQVTVRQPDGQLSPGDQFGATVGGGDYENPAVTPPSATTPADAPQGTATVTDPAILLPNQPYTAEVTPAAGTDGDQYVSNYTCTDVVTGEVVAFGEGTSAPLNLAAGTGQTIDCVFDVEEPQPGIDLVKTVAPDTFDSVDDGPLAYTFTVTNTGNTPLEDLQLTDDLAGLGPITCAPVAEGATLPARERVPGSANDLRPGRTVCTAERPLTPEDVASGQGVVNDAEVSAAPPARFALARAAADDSATAANDVTGPVAVDDSAPTQAGDPVVLPGARNDTPGSAPVVPGSVVLTGPGVAPDGKSLDTDQGSWTVNPNGTVTFTPADGFAGPAGPVTYQVTDGNGLVDTGTLEVVVRPGPGALPDQAGGPQGDPVTVRPLGNDTPSQTAGGGVGSFDLGSLVFDPDAVPAGSTITDDGRRLTVPDQGVWTIDAATGVVTFTPEDTFFGDASEVGYLVTDQAGNTTGSTIAVTVAAVAPVANDDTAATQFDTPVVLPAGNDDAAGPGGAIDPARTRFTDPAADPGGRRLVTDQGVWDVLASGSVRFTPADGYVGTTPQVQYEITDANGQKDDALLQVTVRPGPTASADDAETDQNVDVQLRPLANDVPGRRTDDTAGAFDRATFVLLTTDLPDGSTVSADGRVLTVPGEGVYTFDPVTGVLVLDPAPLFRSATSPVTYEVADQAGNVVTSTVSVLVRAVDPVAVDDTVKTPAGTPITFDPLENDDAGSPAAPLLPGSVVLTSPDATESGKRLEVRGQGVWTVDPDSGEVTFTPAPGFDGRTTPAVEYRVGDENGQTVTADMAVVVGTGPLAAPDDARTPQNVPVTLDVLANDVPGDLGTPCTPPGSDIPAGCDTGTFDPADVVFPADGQPTDAELVGPRELEVPGQGTWTIDPATGAVTFTPEPGFTGPATPVTYEATDSYDNVERATVSVVVRAIRPTATDDVASTPFGTPVTLTGLTDDSPGTDDNGTPDDESDDVTPALRPGLTVFPSAGQPEGAEIADGGTTLEIVDVGVWEIQADGSVLFTPADGFDGRTPAVGYRITDANGTTAVATLVVTVRQGPSAEPETGETAFGTPVDLRPLTNDTPGLTADGAAGTWDLSTFAFVVTDGLPTGSELAPDGSLTVPGEGRWTSAVVDGQLVVTFTPEEGFDATTTPVTYTVDDQAGNAGTSTITVVVRPGPSAQDDEEETLQNVDVTLDPLDNDTPGRRADGSAGSFAVATLAFDETNLPGDSSLSVDGLVLVVPDQGTWRIDRTSGLVTFDPEPGYVGTTTPVGYTVDDAAGNPTAAELTVVVTAVRPTAVDDRAQTPYRTPVTLPVLANDEPGDDSAPFDAATLRLTDADDQEVLRLEVEGEGVWTVEGGTLVFTPGDGFDGETTPVDYVVDDVNGTPTGAVAVVTVRPGPTAEDDATTTPQNRPVTLRPLGNDTPGLRAGGAAGAFDLSTLAFDPAGLPEDSTVSEDGLVLTVPGEGTWTIDRDTGTVRFAPEPAFTGVTSPVDYLVDDVFGNPTGARMMVTIEAVAPRAVDDRARTPYETPVRLDVLANDRPGSTDVPLDRTTLRLLDGEVEVRTLVVDGEGTWFVTANGQLRFVPEDGFTGTTTPVDYVVLDANGTPATAQAVVVVQGPGEALPTSVTTTPATPVTVDVLDNVTPAPGEDLRPGTVCVLPGSITVDGDPVKVAGDQDRCVDRFTQPDVGTWVVDPDGTITFTPAPGFTGDVDIDFQVKDTAGNVYTTTLTVTVVDDGTSPGTTPPGGGVTPGDDGGLLPNTGGPTLLALLAGLALLGGGAAVVRRSRRRA